MTDAQFYERVLFWLKELKATYLCDATNEELVELEALMDEVKRREGGE